VCVEVKKTLAISFDKNPDCCRKFFDNSTRTNKLRLIYLSTNTITISQNPSRNNSSRNLSCSNREQYRRLEVSVLHVFYPILSRRYYRKVLLYSFMCCLGIRPIIAKQTPRCHLMGTMCVPSAHKEQLKDSHKLNSLNTILLIL
jgi:hypothetical protein